MKNPHDVIVAPHITEKSVRLSYGDPTIRDEKQLSRKYTFVVASSANKIEIKAAIEAIYNAGRKPADHIQVESVRTVRVPGKSKRVRTKASAFPRPGLQPSRKKAIITLAKGQILEDYGV